MKVNWLTVSILMRFQKRGYLTSQMPEDKNIISNTTYAYDMRKYWISKPIFRPNSPGVFGHRAIRTMGDRTVAGAFFIEQMDTFYWHARAHTTGFI